MIPQIFQYDFMVRAFIAGSIIAVVAPLIGNFLLIRRYSLFADALSHVSFLSVAIAIVTGLNPIMVSIAGAIIAATGLEKLRATKRVQSESSLALFQSGSLALGTIVLSLANSSAINISSILFGSISTILPSDILIIAVAGCMTIILILVFFKEFFVIAFDEEYARVKGIPVTFLNYLLMILSALVISISITVIGVLLISALMVIPVITSYQFKRGFSTSVVISIACSLVAVWIGLTMAYYFNLPAGGAIVVVLIFLFTVTTSFRRLLQSRK